MNIDFPTNFLLDLYVILKLKFRRGKKNAEVIARDIVNNNFLQTPAGCVRFVNERFKYLSDPLGGLIDIQLDLPAFVSRGGGDCDDFVLAVCRLWQALGLKAYYVTLFSFNMADNHVIAVHEKNGKYCYATPYVYFDEAFDSIGAVIRDFEKLYDVQYDFCSVVDVDQI